VYRQPIVKKMGPKTEPWGTPKYEGNMEEEPEMTEKDLLER